MSYTKIQYNNALATLRYLAKKSNARNPSILRKFVNNEVSTELFASNSFTPNLIAKKG